MESILVPGRFSRARTITTRLPQVVLLRFGALTVVALAAVLNYALLHTPSSTRSMIIWSRSTM
jgi:hypothetical protein